MVMVLKDIQLIKGGSFRDERGILLYNNKINLESIKRIYFIKNEDIKIIRAWQGHQVECRWFSVVQGKFLIKLVKPDDWLNPSKNLDILHFELNSETSDYLIVPPGYATSIQSLENDSKLMVMSNFSLGEINDEYKFEKNYW